MSQQHTSGPWEVGEPNTKGLRYSTVYANTLIAKVYSTVYTDTRQEVANARLIAAAPDLLAVLEEADEIIPPEDLAYLRSRIRAVIAKAKGGAL